MNKQVFEFIIEDNNPNGIIKCTMYDWFGISYKIPRNKIKETPKLEYINNTGLYILFGEDEQTAKKIAYIGEAENVYTRIEQHNRNKDFWNECIVFMSKDNSLNKAHIKYSEHELYVLAKTANRFSIKNESNPTKSSLGDVDEIRAIKFVDNIKTITSLMGYKLFDKLVKEDNNQKNVLYLKNNGIEYATGIVSDEGFVILKGSKIKDGISNGISKSLINYCERERKSSDIVNGVYINDHLCSSPSMAAVIILGRNSNGYTEWKNKENVSLRNIQG